MKTWNLPSDKSSLINASILGSVEPIRVRFINATLFHVSLSLSPSICHHNTFAAPECVKNEEKPPIILRLMIPLYLRNGTCFN